MNSRTLHTRLLAGIFPVLLGLSLHLSAQLSPGDLSQAHAHLEGMSNCTKCHVLRQKVSNDKCLDCHKEMAERITAGKGYHSSTEVTGKECASCHNDHHGRKFEMIRFDADAFDHKLAGYSLQGKHGQLDCRKCHKKEFIGDREIRERSSTYLGLEQECRACHSDVHQSTLGTECASCHGFNSFRPANGFDHNGADFRLLGKHREVDCAKCHKTITRNQQEMQVFKGLDFASCRDCHRDVHQNKFGPDCASCHSELSFHQIKKAGGFKHSTTGFPLRGKHASVSCSSCHKSGYGRSIRYKRCTDCHSDYHRKQFAKDGSSPDCSECHTEKGFSPTLFTIEHHNQGSFSLGGAHLAIPCFDCHRKSERWEFRQIGTKCNECHKDVHASHLDPKYYPDQSCTSCHRDSRWSDIVFDHAPTGYLLEGAHKEQSCRTCHFKKDEQNKTVQQFSQLSSDCVECHREVHHEQFGTQGTLCLKCHDYFDWKAGLFNHDQTRFPLDGRHKDVACAKCHPNTEAAGQVYTLYKLSSITCESCH